MLVFLAGDGSHFITGQLLALDGGLMTLGGVREVTPRQSNSATQPKGVAMDRLGIELLSVFGMPPVEFVNLAADLGCQYISTGMTGFPLPQLGQQEFSLKDDPALRREILAAMDDTGVAIALGDGMLILPGADIADRASDLDTLAELRVPRVNSVSLDPDRARTFDQLALLAELGADRGMETTIEPAPGTTVGDLTVGLAALKHVGRADFRLLIDAMHLVRSGYGAADLAALDPDLIGYAQLSDTTLQPRDDNYMREATFERLVPGEGELPLFDILKALPPDVVIGLEVPRLSLAEAGVSHVDRLRPCVEAARGLLTESL
jgi:sugar phosphate isomerase/epimerase